MTLTPQNSPSIPPAMNTFYLSEKKGYTFKVQLPFLLNNNYKYPFYLYHFKAKTS
jgi:hypothetical protein